MTDMSKNRGGAPVGYITDLSGVEAACVVYLRMWCEGPDAQSTVWNDFAASLGSEQGRRALRAFEDLCKLCDQYGRRPLMRHALHRKCLGCDEACFANFVTTAATGAREDAMLIATLLVRADVAPLITGLASEFGHALMRMNLSMPSANGSATDPHSQSHSKPMPQTLH